MRAAVVNLNKKIVTNIIIANPDIDKCPYEGHTLLKASDEVQVGFLWDGHSFINPAPPLQPQPTIPKSITPRQCRLILSQRGMLTTVESIISGMDEATKITWEYALEFRRDDPLLNQLATNLGLTTSQVDEFFIEAAKL